jgi:hypothetical protein
MPELTGDWIQYEAEGAAAAETEGNPTREDLAVPASERATFAAVAGDLGLVGLHAPEAMRKIQDHFASFSYSTWREKPAPEGTTAAGRFHAQRSLRPLRVLRRRDRACCCAQPAFPRATRPVSP